MLPLIILDLDETLIRCTDEFWDFAPSFSFRLEGRVLHMYVRPYILKLLEALRPYRIAIWTAATREYAISAVRRLFGPRWISRIEFLYDRRHCILWRGRYVKDLRQVDEECLLIDDDPGHILFRHIHYPHDLRHRILHCRPFVSHRDVELTRIARILRHG